MEDSAEWAEEEQAAEGDGAGDCGGLDVGLGGCFGDEAWRLLALFEDDDADDGDNDNNDGGIDNNNQNKNETCNENPIIVEVEHVGWCASIPTFNRYGPFLESFAQLFRRRASGFSSLLASRP